MKTSKDIQLQSRPAHTIPAKTVSAVIMDWAKTAKLIEEDGQYACRLNDKGDISIFEGAV